MDQKRTAYLAGCSLIAGLILGVGCATKKFVQTEVSTVDKKVEGVETTVEANQKRLKEHDERLATLGSLIAQHDAQLKQQESQFKNVEGKIEEVKKYARGTLIYKEVLKNNEATFAFDSFELGPEAKTALEKFVQMLITQDRGVYLEIQGHTDNTGEESWNLELGKKRAEAVRDYLYKQYHIPLHRMEIITFGSSQPVADNSTREGRAKNRRVEILVYE
jgi:outer membrane protein OmpA-like peptidoglycan-associated protein